MHLIRCLVFDLIVPNHYHRPLFIIVKRRTVLSLWQPSVVSPPFESKVIGLLFGYGSCRFLHSVVIKFGYVFDCNLQQHIVRHCKVRVLCFNEFHLSANKMWFKMLRIEESLWMCFYVEGAYFDGAFCLSWHLSHCDDYRYKSTNHWCTFALNEMLLCDATKAKRTFASKFMCTVTRNGFNIALVNRCSNPLVKDAWKL